VADWRREVVNAVDEVLKRSNRGGQGGWRQLGRVTPLPETGWYALDLHTGNRKPPSADGLDQLCFAGREGPDRGTSIAVERSQITDEILRVQVAGSLPEGCDLLWTVRLTPHYLWRKLRDGIEALGTAPLADKLAAGRLDPVSERGKPDYPPGFLATQRRAYRACVEPGLHTVWGPPGTGKTRVLARAIEDLVRDGRRVLLVSTANIAVDNALKEVINHLKPDPGVVIRVGTPHLPELANNDNVQLHRLAARTTAEVDAERLRVQQELQHMSVVDAEVRALEEALAGYDHDAYLETERRISRARELTVALGEQRIAESEYDRTDRELSAIRAEVTHARAELDRLAPHRAALDRVRELRAQLAELDHDLSLNRSRVARLTFQVGAEAEGWLARKRRSRELRDAQTRLTQLERHTVQQHQLIDPVITDSLRAAHPVTEADLARMDERIRAAEVRLAAATPQAADAIRWLREIRTRTADLERQGVATAEDHELVAAATAAGLPGKHQELATLRERRQRQERERSKLEDNLRALTKRITELRKDAEGKIVAEAQVVATTLARSRAHRAVAGESFDVVLVDEAGAAVVGEVLLAVSQATRTATLLGDFLQLGPVTPDVDKIKDPAVQKWLRPDGFTHCGIRVAADVPGNPGCVGLRHQFRFGPNLRRLANDVVYGVLADGVTEVSGRPPEDTEIVLVDVHGLPELNQVHRSGAVAGWWPVGALLSRSLVQHHVVDGGGVGVVTTFRQQVDATHAALRDSGQNLSVPVGTAHSFQGREFDTVVFDLVEDGQGWISKAKWEGSDFERSGVRLFGVGITRARKQLYVIANANLAVKGAHGETPLSALRRLGEDKGVQWCRAAVLLGMAEHVDYTPVSRVEAELNEVLRGLVDVTDVHDEFSFDQALENQLSAVRTSLWMWSPWVATKSRRFLPLISDAVARNVDVRVFVRTERDHVMRTDSAKRWVGELEATGAKVIRAEVEHRKIIIVDEHLTLLGSHNPLSQRHSREVMIACRGAAFAERMLTELNAKAHGKPPFCTRCSRDFELWRSSSRRRNTPYFWRCHPCGTDLDVTPSP
jgi:hypothetical protein